MLIAFCLCINFIHVQQQSCMYVHICKHCIKVFILLACTHTYITTTVDVNVIW